MADTIGSLIEDIEKRMIDLGYEDFEILYSPDHDIKSLKALKRQLMDEKKQRQLEKKERSKNTNVLRDLLVKITRVFRKDFYIYNATYVIPGELSQENLKGEYLLKIQESYQESLRKILFKENTNTILFIPDVSLLKEIIDNNIMDEDKIFQECIDKGAVKILQGIYHKDIVQQTDEMKKYDEIVHLLNEELNGISKDANEFITCDINIDDDPEIISMKKLFLIQYKNLPPIEGNIQLFPFFTEKEDTPIEFMTNIMDDSGNMNIYYGRFHVTYSYFDIYIKLVYI